MKERKEAFKQLTSNTSNVMIAGDRRTCFDCGNSVKDITGELTCLPISVVVDLKYINKGNIIQIFNLIFIYRQKKYTKTLAANDIQKLE